VSGFNLSLFLSTQAMASLVAFGSYVHMGNTLSADVVFTCVSVFVSAQFYCMYQFPFAMEFHSEFKVTCKRIEDIMKEVERAKMPISQELSLKFDVKAAAWALPKPDLPEMHQLNSPLFSLKNIVFEVLPGQLCVIVGPVASGKTSLLMSILGELPYLQGTLSRPARLSYFAQEPWILSSTVKDNIIMGRTEDQERYRKVVKMCSLEQDFEAFPLRDQTEIGERGVNISGGQKARIALARAVYEQADLYLFDDPLSAVDAIVSANIMKNCILGDLMGKTRVLVTHQVKYAQYGDLVVVLDAGRVKSCGSYQEVKDFFPISAENEEELEQKEKITSVNVFAMEENQQGSIPLSIYYKYLIAGFGCGLSLLLVLLIYCFVQAIYLLILRWLAYWTAQSDQENPIYLKVLISLVFGLLLTSTLRNEIVILGIIRAAKSLHLRIFHNLLRTPIEFFDWNPTGVILNRFSKDIGVLDEMLGLTICDTLQAMFIALGAVGMIVYVNPYMVILLVIMGVYYYFLLRWVLPVTRDVKRLEAIARSPVFSLLSSTLPGLATIRSMCLGASLQARFAALLDLNLLPLFWYYNVFRWMSLRVDASASLFTSANVLLAVCLRSYVNAEDMALSLSFTLQLVTYVIWTVKRMLETDMAMVSAERVMKYTELDQEKDRENAQKYQFCQGKIEFREVVLRYRKDFDPVLKGVSCLFPAKSKIGIVGRTGSGKSRGWR
jgi:ATP-binding cassette subfamily C (CFTR/MRP) protein 4